LPSSYLQETNLRLGLPAVVTHIIHPNSPLYNLSLAELEVRAVVTHIFHPNIPLHNLPLAELEVCAKSTVQPFSGRA